MSNPVDPDVWLFKGVKSMDGPITFEWNFGDKNYKGIATVKEGMVTHVTGDLAGAWVGMNIESIRKYMQETDGFSENGKNKLYVEVAHAVAKARLEERTALGAEILSKMDYRIEFWEERKNYLGARLISDMTSYQMQDYRDSVTSLIACKSAKDIINLALAKRNRQCGDA